MAQKGEYRKIKNCWGWKPEVQRAAENEFYGKADDKMRHKKKSHKRGKDRSDHKHVYVEAVIYKNWFDGVKRPYNGKVCSICGKQHSKNWMSSFHTQMGRKEVYTDGLPLYEAVDDNTAIPIETEDLL